MVKGFTVSHHKNALPNLKQEIFCCDVIHQTRVVFIHYGELVASSAHVQTSHGCGLFEKGDGKEVVHKNLQDLMEKHKKQEN